MFNLVLGPMMAGKTSHIQPVIVQAVKAKRHVILLCPNSMLDRWPITVETKENATISGKRVAHSGHSYCPASLNDEDLTYYHELYIDPKDLQTNPELTHLLKQYPTAELILDEIQFFDDMGALKSLILPRSNAKLSVTGFGLNLDWKRQIFPTVLECMRFANRIQNLRATCSQCGKKGNFTKKIEKPGNALQDAVVDVLGTYEPRCFNCFFIGDKRPTPKHKGKRKELEEALAEEAEQTKTAAAAVVPVASSKKPDTIPNKRMKK